jgi:hypothetical protein
VLPLKITFRGVARLDTAASAVWQSAIEDYYRGALEFDDLTYEQVVDADSVSTLRPHDDEFEVDAW